MIHEYIDGQRVVINPQKFARLTLEKPSPRPKGTSIGEGGARWEIHQPVDRPISAKQYWRLRPGSKPKTRAV